MSFLSRYLAALILFIVLESLLAIYLHSLVLINGDVAMHINAAQRILEGERLYKDMITIGMPVQFYMRIPVIWLAQWFSTDVFLVARIFDNGIALFTMLLVLTILRKTRLCTTLEQNGYWGVLLIFIFFFLPLPLNAVGEKEYFYWLLTIPYFTLCAAYAQGECYSRGLRILVGCVAAVGFVFKPMCIFPLILVELDLWYQHRRERPWLRVELITCLYLGCMYLIWIVVALPDYFTTIVPLARFYYEMRPDFFLLIHRYATGLLPYLTALVVLGLYLHQANNLYRKFFRIYGLAFIGYAMESISQLKPFDHHVFPIPAMALLIFSAAVMALKLQETPASIIDNKWSWPKSPSALVGLVLIGLLGQSLFFGFIYTATNNGNVFDRGDELLAEMHFTPPYTYYTISVRTAPMFPTGIMQGIPWDYHFNHQWLFDGIKSYKRRHFGLDYDQPLEETQKAENFMRRVVTDDLKRLKPMILLISRLDNVDYVRYFSRDEGFKKVMSQYKFTTHFSGWDYYILQGK